MSAAARNGERSVLLLIAGVIAFVAVIYAESVASMARYWQYSEHQHGLIVVPVCAYLLWRLRGTLARAQLGPWPPGVAMLAAVPAMDWPAALAFSRTTMLDRAISSRMSSTLQPAIVSLMVPATLCAFVTTCDLAWASWALPASCCRYQ